MTERHRQVTPDQVLEQNTGLDENRSDVGQNVPNGISRRGFLRLGLTAAVLAATEGMGLERVEAQDGSKGEEHEQGHDRLQEALDNWVSGETVIKDEDRFVDQGEPVQLGVIGDYRSRKEESVRVAITDLLIGMLLGSEVVDNHLIVYVGFEDNSGGRFYVPFDFWEMDQEIVPVALFPQDNDALFPQGMRRADLVVGGRQLQPWIERLWGDIVRVSILGSGSIFEETPTDWKELYEYSRSRISMQVELAEKFQDFLYEVKVGNARAEDIERVREGWANRRMESYDPEGCLASLQIDYRIRDLED